MAIIPQIQITPIGMNCLIIKVLDRGLMPHNKEVLEKGYNVTTGYRRKKEVGNMGEKNKHECKTRSGRKDVEEVSRNG